MFELRDALKSKVYTIKEEVLKNINKLNLNLHEFLLLIYFINGNEDFDPKKVNKYIGLDEKISMETFNSLIKKKIIEVKVKKGKIVEEIISLDLFYNKLLLDTEKEEKESSDIFTVFEKEFGRMLSPFEYEIINNWLEKKIAEDLIIKALREAVLCDVKNLRYIDKILFEWTKKGIKSNNKSTMKDEKLFDYNWLDDNE